MCTVLPMTLNIPAIRVCFKIRYTKRQGRVVSTQASFFYSFRVKILAPETWFLDDDFEVLLRTSKHIPE